MTTASHVARFDVKKFCWLFPCLSHCPLSLELECTRIQCAKGRELRCDTVFDVMPNGRDAVLLLLEVNPCTLS